MKKTKRLPRATFSLPDWILSHLNAVKKYNRRRSLQAAFEDAMKDAAFNLNHREK